jgi:hypothetical protein
MAATFATIRSITANVHENQWNALDESAARKSFASTSCYMLPAEQTNNPINQSAKARARMYWKMLRTVIRNLEFPRIVIAEEKLVEFKRRVPKLESSSSFHKNDLSSDWLSQLQDFWCGPHITYFSMKHPLLLPHKLHREQSCKARRRLLAGRGPKELDVKVDSRSWTSAIRAALNTTPSILEPGSKFMVGWALMQAVLLLYITIVVPFTAVFLSDLDCFPSWSISIDLIIDTYFLADILVNAVRFASFMSLAAL